MKKVLLFLTLLLLISPVIADACILSNSTSTYYNANSIWVDITGYNTEIKDDNNMHESNNNYITVNKSDYYIVNAQIYVDSGTGLKTVRILMNSTELIRNNQEPYRSVSVITYINKDSIVKVQVYNTDNSTFRIYSYQASPIFSIIQINQTNDNTIINNTTINTTPTNPLSPLNNIVNPARWEPYFIISLILLVLGIYFKESLMHWLGCSSGIVSALFFVSTYGILNGVILTAISALIFLLIIINGLLGAMKK
jgi:hypothetical protein